MAKAIIYTRVSTDKQQANGDSLEAQELDCRADCEKNGNTVVAVESDTFTGHDSMYDRPGMQRALATIRSGDADLLVVKRLTRVARDMVDGQVFLREVAEAGGALRSTVEGTFTGKLDDMLLMAIHAFQAEKDWETIRQQSQQGLRSRVARGRPLVSVQLFGYRFLDGKYGEKYRKKSLFEIDPEAAPTVQDIFARARDGQSTWAIANYLNDHKISTPSQLMYSRGELGKRRLKSFWSAGMVHGILENESYTGRHAAYKHKWVLVKKNGSKPAYKRLDRPPEETVRINIPALIDDVTWNTVQEKIPQRNTLIGDPPLLNQGFAICGVCGSKMIAARQSASPDKYRIYCCKRRTSLQQDRCPGGYFVVKCDDMDRDIWNKVKEIIRDAPKFQRLIQGKTAKLEEEHAEAVRRAESMQRELSNWREKQATVFANMSKETDDTIRAMYRTELQRINETVAALKKRLEAAHSTLSTAKQERDAHQELLKSVVDTAEWWKGYYASVGMQPEEGRLDPAEHIQQAENLVLIVEQIDLDGLDRKQKRRIMQAIDVKVKMHPKNYVDADGKKHERGELEFDPHALSNVFS